MQLSSPFRAARTIALVVAALLALSACGGGGGSSGDAGAGGVTGGDTGSGTGGGTGSTASYKILGANDLGMHCVDADFSVFSILPPYNVVNAQVLRTDASGKPALQGDGAVALRYSAVADPNGSINSRSQDKTNFWRYAARTYGANLQPGQGLKGLYMPAEATTAQQTSFAWHAGNGLFKAEGIPIVPVDDAGRINRYPLLRLTATDKASGQSLATLDIVLPVSEETTCSDCHATGTAAARAAGIAWSTAGDLEVQSRENVLLLHDSRRGTSLFASRPVLCAACHYSAALDLAGTGPSGTQVGRPTMSAAMHAYHASRMRDATGAPLADRWVAQGGLPPSPATQACYSCHPGRSTQCLRGAMTDTVTCQNCHGGMGAVGGAASLAAGGSIDGQNDGKAQTALGRLAALPVVPHRRRREPPHAGGRIADGGRRHPHAGRVRQRRCGGLAAQGVEHPLRGERQLAVPLQQGARRRGLRGMPQQHSRHLANDTVAHNDNVAPQQLQGHTGTIVECTTCHGAGTLAASLDGPHGMHVVNDARWRQGGHGSLAERNRQACAACHGTTFRGTVLSRTAAQRSWGSRTVARGVAVGCYDCHNGPNGGD